MRRRAMGNETEYGLTAIGPDGKPYPYNAATFMHSNCYLRNGARRYPDIGNHPEYATPECDTIDDLVAHVFAGHRKMRQLINDATVELRSEGYEIGLYCNNVCNYGEFPQSELTYGTHESYQYQSEDTVLGFTAPLVAYLATRHLVLGAGRLVLDYKGGYRFELSQRAGFMERSISSATTNGRPIVNTREEPHAKDGTRRLHLIVGDNLNLPQLVGLKFAIMCVLLTMREEGLLKGLTLANPVQAMRETSRDPAAPVQLADSTETMTIWEIQQFYYEQARAFVDSEPDMAEYRPWIVQWGRHQARLSWSLDPSDHLKHLAWANKQVLAERYISRNPAPISAGARALRQWSNKMQGYELDMYRVSGTKSAMDIIQSHFGDYEARRPAIDEACILPPKTTRAWVRGLVAEIAATNVAIRVVDWGVVMTVGAGGREDTHRLGVPLDAAIPDWLMPYLEESDEDDQLAA